MMLRYKLWRFPLVASILLLLSTSLSAQQRVSSYTVQNFTGSFNSIASTGNVLDFYGNIWFSGYASFTMPFDFSYDNQTIYAGTTVGLSGGGSIDLGYGHPYYGSGQGSSSYPALLTFFGGWIVTGDGDHGDNNNYYLVTGSAPNRVLTIEARRIHFCGAGNGRGDGGQSKQIAVQVKLYEATGNIEYLYSSHSLDMGYDNCGGTGGAIGLNGFTSPSFEFSTVSGGTMKSPANDYRFLAQPPAQLALSPESIDYGQVIAGSSSTLCATLSNVGSGTLHVQAINVIGNPDYQITSAPAIGTAYSTNQTAQICVRFAPIASGTRSAVLSVVTDGADSGTQIITLTGVGAAPGIEMPVRDMFRKTRVRVGQTAMQALPIHSTGQGPLTILSTSISGLNADNYEITRVPPPIPVGAWDSIYVMFKPTFEGKPDATITINSDGLNEPQIFVHTFGVGVMPRLAITPSTLDFDSVNVGQQACTNVMLSNSGSDTVAITRNYKSGGDYDFTFTPLTGTDTLIAPGQQRAFNICFTPLRNGLRTATLRFYSDIPRTIPGDRDTSQIQLTIYGVGVPFGSLAFQGAAVDTAIVGIQNCVTQNITNIGTADMTVTSASLTGQDAAEFSFSGLTLPFTLRAGESKSVTYCLTPTQRGDRVASLMLTGTTEGTPATMTLPILGYGVEVCANASPTSAFATKTMVGKTDTATITVTNCGDLATAYTAALPAGTTKYMILGAPTSGSVAAAGTASFQVVYTPTAIGADASALTITGGTGVTPMSINLGGVGAGVMASATTANAGSVMKGNCEDFTVTITNNGNVDWTPGTPTISGANSGDFTFVSLSPTTITAGGTATLTLRFCPTTTSGEGATLTFDASSPTPLSPFSVPLTGTGQVNGVMQIAEMNGFILGQSYPNPMQQTSSFIVTVPTESLVRIDLVDATGNIVRTVTTERMPAGAHPVSVDARGLANGTYYYMLTSGTTRLMRELTIRK